MKHPTLVRTFQLALALTLACASPTASRAEGGELLGMGPSTPREVPASREPDALVEGPEFELVATPEDPRRELAGQVLARLGFPGASTTARLRQLFYSYTYTWPGRSVGLATALPRDTVRITGAATVEAALRREVRLYKQARTRWAGLGTISEAATPALYASWRDGAAALLTRVPATHRRALLHALMRKETGRVHWRDLRPVVSPNGAVGFTQLLARTAASPEGGGANPYDPAESVRGCARYLNYLIGLSGGSIATGVARYHDGMRVGAGGRAYARDILRWAGLAGGSGRSQS